MAPNNKEQAGPLPGFGFPSVGSPVLTTWAARRHPVGFSHIFYYFFFASNHLHTKSVRPGGLTSDVFVFDFDEKRFDRKTRQKL